MYVCGAVDIESIGCLLYVAIAYLLYGGGCIVVLYECEACGDSACGSREGVVAIVEGMEHIHLAVEQEEVLIHACSTQRVEPRCRQLHAEVDHAVVDRTLVDGAWQLVGIEGIELRHIVGREELLCVHTEVVGELCRGVDDDTGIIGEVVAKECEVDYLSLRLGGCFACGLVGTARLCLLFLLLGLGLGLVEGQLEVSLGLVLQEESFVGREVVVVVARAVGAVGLVCSIPEGDRTGEVEVVEAVVSEEGVGCVVPTLVVVFDSGIEVEHDFLQQVAEVGGRNSDREFS